MNKEVVKVATAKLAKVFIVNNSFLLRIIEEQRYLDNDGLTAEQEDYLQTIPSMIIEYYGNNQRTYTLYGNYK